MKNMIIINADDFGRSKEINQAVIDLFKTRSINRATIMVNMPEAESAAEEIKKIDINVQEQIGIHLNLGTGRPITSTILGTSLCDDGAFNHTEESPSYRLYMKKSLRDAVEEELDGQFKSFLKMFGHYPKHVDSHCHFHNFLPYLFIIVKLSKKYNVESMRIPINLYNRRSIVKSIYKWFVILVIRSNFNCTDYMGSRVEYQQYGYIVGGDKSVEIMTHPTYHAGSIVDIIYEEDGSVNHLNFKAIL